MCVLTKEAEYWYRSGRPKTAGTVENVKHVRLNDYNSMRKHKADVSSTRYSVN